MQKNSIGRKIMMTLATVVTIGLVVFIVYRFNYVENAKPDDTVSRYLVCNANNLDSYLLTKDMGEQDVDYEARIMFLDEQIYRANFVISKQFPSADDTHYFTDRIVAAYNNYIGNNNISKNLIINSVSNVDNIGKMVISIEGGKYTDKMAQLVMLDGVNTSVSADEARNHYEQNGFICSVSEQDMILSE